MAKDSNIPNSDETARNKHNESASEDVAPAEDLSYDGLQTSTKSGKHSSVEKLGASRPEFGTGRGAVPVDGAFGNEDEHPETTRVRCVNCGRYFNTKAELTQHALECDLAKQASAGQKS